jgi:hypothetical protein
MKHSKPAGDARVGRGAKASAQKQWYDLAFGRRGQEEHERWASLLGRFLLSFSDIENGINFGLEWLSDESETFIRLELGRRIEHLGKITREMVGISDDARENLIAALAATKDLSKTRNVIAHTPVLLTSHKQASGEWTHGYEMNSKRGITIDVEKMQELLNQAEGLREQIWGAVSRVRRERAQTFAKEERNARRRAARRAKAAKHKKINAG